jgi:mono/diheme cytochrome c family protein
MEKTLYGGLAIVCLMAAGSPASAQSNGERIARTWCAGCHQIQAEAPRAGGNDVVPSFASIAQMNSTTETSLEVFLSTPHARMPDYNLTRDEIHDVSAYILSLKK